MATSVPSPLHPRHAGVDPRHGYHPPRIIVPRLGPDARPDAMGLVRCLTDGFGEVFPEQPSIRLGWTPEALHLVAIVKGDPVRAPEREADHPDFWRQDHVELRLLPDPARDLDHRQFLLAANGRFIGPSGAVTLRVSLGGGYWSLDARLAMDTPLEQGQVLRGLVAAMSWAEGWPRMACCVAAQLGFSQAERFAEFVLDGPEGEGPRVTWLHLPVGPLPRGRVGAELAVQNPSGTPVETTLRVGGQSRRVTIPPDGARLPIELELSRPAYTYLDLRLGDQDLGSICLRAAVPPLRAGLADTLEHPCLLPPTADLRAKAAHEPFAGWLADTPAAPEPAPAAAGGLDFVATDGNWLRVCRESFLRPKKADDRAARRIWERLEPAAQEAAGRIDASAGRDPHQIDVLLNGLNGLLADPALYDAEAFARTALPSATRQALADPARLDPRMLTRHNRTLIQCSIECIRECRVDLAANAARYLTPWLIDGDPTHIRQASRYLALAADTMITNPHMDLHTGGLAGSLALAYDAFAPHLLDRERPVWGRVLRQFLLLYLDTARACHWNTTAIPNANPVCNGGGGLLALALLREEPELAAEALQLARTYLWNFVDYCAGPDGGNTEGAQYWQYGMENALRFVIALERVTHSHDGFLDSPAFTQLLAMVRLGLCPDGGMHGVNDTIPMPVGGALGWFAAGRFDDPLGLWYGDHAVRYARRRQADGKPCPYSAAPLDMLLYRPLVPEATDAPPLPQSVLLADIQYGTLRSQPRYDAPLVAGLKGARPPYTHHNQPDAGSVFIHLRGERLVIDPGYYKDAEAQHSLLYRPTPGSGARSPQGYTARLRAASHLDRHLLTADLGAARGLHAVAQRYRRHLILIGDHTAVVVDDIFMQATDPDLTLAWQCGGPTNRLDDGRVRITGQHATLMLETLCVADSTLGDGYTTEPERDLHDTHWGYHFADCRLFPVHASLANDQHPRRVAVTILSDATTGDPGRAHLTAAMGARMLIHLPHGQNLILTDTPTGWQPDLAARA